MYTIQKELSFNFTKHFAAFLLYKLAMHGLFCEVMIGLFIKNVIAYCVNILRK